MCQILDSQTTETKQFFSSLFTKKLNEFCYFCSSSLFSKQYILQVISLFSLDCFLLLLEMKDVFAFRFIENVADLTFKLLFSTPRLSALCQLIYAYILFINFIFNCGGSTNNVPNAIHQYKKIQPQSKAWSIILFGLLMCPWINSLARKWLHWQPIPGNFKGLEIISFASFIVSTMDTETLHMLHCLNENTSSVWE